jgi:hypothetical protein
MNKNEMDNLAWRIMLENEEYEELNRIFALNGVLYENYFEHLTSDEQDDVLTRLAIGIQVFNAQVKADIEDARDWRKLPHMEVSGNDKS